MTQSSGKRYDQETYDMATRTTILRAVVGSSAHGLSVGDDDTDEMGVCIEDPEHMIRVTGPSDKPVRGPFEQLIHRTAAIRTGDHSARSQPGDLDLTIFSLKKWAGLALGGNPTALLLLYAPPGKMDARGVHLREMAPRFVSQRCGSAYVGYMVDQLERLLGLRGGLKVHRPELVEKYGFDTKYAGHVIRLGYQGVELMTTGKLTLPMTGAAREQVLGVRNGAFTFGEVVGQAKTLLDVLKRTREEVAAAGSLPEYPDVEYVSRWVSQSYVDTWISRRYVKWAIAREVVGQVVVGE
jgi:hypothetical protein